MTHSKTIHDRYTIEKLDPIGLDQAGQDFWMFALRVAVHLNERYGFLYDFKKFSIYSYAEEHRITLCRRDSIPVGIMLARLSDSVFDPGVKMLRQDLLYAKPGSRAVKFLFEDFIDFGKANANHVITNIGRRTNINERTLVKYGFSELETLYRLGV